MSSTGRFEFTLDEETEKRLYELLTDIDVRNTNRFWITDKRGYRAEYVKVRHGKWIRGNPICPCCGEDKFKDLDADIWADWQPKYCPNCGAKMDEKQESDKYDTRIKDIT